MWYIKNRDKTINIILKLFLLIHSNINFKWIETWNKNSISHNSERLRMMWGKVNFIISLYNMLVAWEMLYFLNYKF